MKVAISYLKSDNYENCISLIDKSVADYIHCDLCDGKYVENRNFSKSSLEKLFKNANKPLDVHLMCKKPEKYFDTLALLNTETITFHKDCDSNIEQLITEIKALGIKVGIAINPGQQYDDLVPFLDIIDEILIMSVVPGKGGQKFMPEVLSTIEFFSNFKSTYNFIIAVDGGINNETIAYLNNYDVDLVISGSYITDSEDYDQKIGTLK